MQQKETVVINLNFFQWIITVGLEKFALLFTVVNNLLYNSPVQLCHTMHFHSLVKLDNFWFFISHIGLDLEKIWNAEQTGKYFCHNNTLCLFESFNISILNINFQEFKVSNRMHSFYLNLASALPKKKHFI